MKVIRLLLNSTVFTLTQVVWGCVAAARINDTDCCTSFSMPHLLNTTTNSSHEIPTPLTCKFDTSHTALPFH